MTTKYFTITAGPSWGELWDAGKYAFDGKNKLVVEFEGHFQEGGIVFKLKAQIIGLAHESGSGRSFIVMANLEGAPWNEKGLMEFYYDADRRSGTIKVP